MSLARRASARSSSARASRPHPPEPQHPHHARASSRASCLPAWNRTRTRFSRAASGHERGPGAAPRLPREARRDALPPRTRSLDRRSRPAWREVPRRRHPRSARAARMPPERRRHRAACGAPLPAARALRRGRPDSPIARAASTRVPPGRDRAAGEFVPLSSIERFGWRNGRARTKRVVEKAVFRPHANDTRRQRDPGDPDGEPCGVRLRTGPAPEVRDRSLNGRCRAVGRLIERFLPPLHVERRVLGQQEPAEPSEGAARYQGDAHEDDEHEPGRPQPMSDLHAVFARIVPVCPLTM